MTKLITICAVLCLALSSACALGAIVTPPPGAPGWWNTETAEYYAYGWWSADIIGGDAIISPPDDSSHWASNFLNNTDFTANIGVTDQTIAVNLNNQYRPDLYKVIYIYITGTTASTVENVDTVLDTGGTGVFTGQQRWDIGENGDWTYALEGEIHPQPEFVRATFTVPGMTNVTGIWAGEVCIPEPATMSLLSIGALSLIRRKRLA
jgi:hypothetical protein